MQDNNRRAYSLFLSLLLLLSSAPLGVIAQNDTTTETTDTEKPVMSDISPSETELSAGTYTFSVTVTDDIGVESCDFIVDGEIIHDTLIPGDDNTVSADYELVSGSLSIEFECEDAAKNSEKVTRVYDILEAVEEVTEEVTGDLDSHLDSLSLSSDEMGIADTIISYVNDCASRVAGSDYKDIQFECEKDSYFIKEQLEKISGISDSDWDEVIDYIMIKSNGEPNWWLDGDRVNVDNWKEVVQGKLNLNIGRDDSTDEVWGGSLWVNLESLSDSEKEAAQEGRERFWEWENEQRSNKLKSELSVSVSGDSESVSNEIINLLDNFRNIISSYDSSPSADKAYEAAYQQRIVEATIRGLSDTLEDAREVCDYVKINGPGTLDVWENEFGDAQTGGLRVYRSSDRRGLEASFDCWEDDFQDKTWLNFWMNWDKDTRENYEDELKRAHKDAESEARRLEVAGKLQEFLDDFSISDDNEEIAKEITDGIDAFVTKLESFTLTETNVYDIEYESRLLNAKVNGLAEALECEDQVEIKEYILLFSKGTTEVWTDEFGDNILSNWKQLYDSDNLKANFNSWGCTDFEEFGGMSVDINWNRETSSAYKEAIKKARNDSRKEEEALRRAHLVIKARQEYDFSFEEEEIGNKIIEKLETFRERVKLFEQGEISAYQLHYDNIILTSELEGMAFVYGDISENVGTYVILYGPGTPDVWKQWDSEEIEVGHNLRINAGEEIEFSFNSWFDEFSGQGGFNTWLNWGKLRKEYKDELKRAERDAWQEAERQRRFRMAEKLRDDLEEYVGEGADAVISEIRNYAVLVKKYLAGADEVTAYDVELKRLQVSDLMRDITEEEMQYFMVADVGEDLGAPEVWYNFETEEIEVGGWRDLVRKNVTKRERTFQIGVAGMSGWCDFYYFEGEGLCNVELNMNWDNWREVQEELGRANELFFRQKREAEISDILNEIVDRKDSYSASDIAIENELVNLFAEAKEIGESFDSIGAAEFQYQVLVKRDQINDKLDEATDETIIEIAVVEADGFHDYDRWFEELRGVVLYSDENVEMSAYFFREFTPFFVEESESELEDEFRIEINIVWKKWSPELERELKTAFERYEQEQSAVRLDKLIEKRDKILSEITEENLRAKVEEYEAGGIRMGQLRKYVESRYFKLKAYDEEVAYLAALIDREYPAFEPINIKIETENVNLQFFERDFDYRFGGGVGLSQVRFGEREERREFEFAPEDIQSTKSIRTFKDDVEIDEAGNLIDRPTLNEDKGNFQIFQDAEIDVVSDSGEVNVNIQGNVEGDVIINVYHEDIAEEIEEAKREIREEKELAIQEIYEARDNVFSDRTHVRRKDGFGLTDESGQAKRLRIKGIKPRMKLRINPTDDEIKAIAENIRAKFIEAQEAGVIDDIIYSMNLRLDDTPSLSDALAEWGDTTTSFKLTYKDETLFEFSFRTEDGYISWAKYGIDENAGADDTNIYIGLQLESIIKLRNWWEQRAKEMESPADFIAMVPGFVKNVGGMVLSGEIEIKPFGAVFKIPKFMEVLFGGLGQSAGFDEI